MLDGLRTFLSWILIAAPVLAVMAMILWDVRGPPSGQSGRLKLFDHGDRIIELALLTMFVVFGGIQLGINDRQGKTTKKQTEIMERQTKLSEVVERPWIAIEGIEVLSPLAFKDGSAILLLRFYSRIQATFRLHMFS